MIEDKDESISPNFSAKYISLFNHNKAHYIKMLFNYDIKNLWKAEDEEIIEFKAFLLDNHFYELAAYIAKYEYHTYAKEYEDFFCILLTMTDSNSLTKRFDKEFFYYCLENIVFNEKEIENIIFGYINFSATLGVLESDFKILKNLLIKQNFHITDSSFHINGLDYLFHNSIYINDTLSRFKHFFYILKIIDPNLLKYKNIHYQILFLLSNMLFNNLIGYSKPIDLFLSIVQFLKKEGLILNEINSDTEITVVSDIVNFIIQQNNNQESNIFSFFALQKIGFNLNVNIKLKNDYINTEGNFYDILNELGFSTISDLLKNQEIETEQLNLNNIFNSNTINTRL